MKYYPINISKFLIWGLLLFPGFSIAQNFTLSGTVIDSSNGEALIAATVWVEGYNKGCVTNAYGFYSLQLPMGNYTINYSYVGFDQKSISVVCNKNIQQNIKLINNSLIEEVNVKADRNNQQIGRMSVIGINISQTHKTPTLMGEPDVFKIMQMAPRVEGGLEGSSGLYVRGGDNGQNLILIDGMPVYNVSHLMGYISVFNPEAIRNAELIKGGIPAHYGGRASSVVDVRMKEGNANKLSGAINVSTIMTGGLIEGPIGEKSSFMLAGRRTVLDPLYSRFNNTQVTWDLLYSCWDINTKVNHTFDDKNRLFLSFFTGYDNARTTNDETVSIIEDKKRLLNGDFLIDTVEVTHNKNEKHKWGNILSAVRWNHIFNQKLFSNTSFTYTNYYNRHQNKFVNRLYNIRTGSSRTQGSIFQSTSDIEDWSGLTDFDWYVSPVHTIKFGAQGIYHRFRPTATIDTLQTVVDFNNRMVREGLEAGLYAEDEITWKQFECNFGLRASIFNLEKTTYNFIEPRFTIAYNATNKLTLKASYMKAGQYVHLVSSSSVGFSTDYWVPASKALPPEVTKQIAVGVIYNLKNKYSFDFEGYYKDMDKLIEFKDDKVFTMDDENWEDFMTYGKGWAYGIESVIRKEQGKFTGWLSYTWSRSWRKFANLNQGDVFPFKYDRPHNFTFVAMFAPNKRIDFGVNWLFTSGYHYTFGKEKIGNWPTYYFRKNNMRYPMYHRLDVGVNLNKQKKHGKRTWRLGAYNVYNHMNTSYYRITMDQGHSYMDENWNEVYVEPKTTITKVILFPIIPYISYRFAFGE